MQIDEALLKRIADRRPAASSSARPTRRRCATIFERIDRLEKSEIKLTAYRRYRELFPPVLPATAALLAGAAALLWRPACAWCRHEAGHDLRVAFLALGAAALPLLAAAVERACRTPRPGAHGAAGRAPALGARLRRPARALARSRDSALLLVGARRHRAGAGAPAVGHRAREGRARRRRRRARARHARARWRPRTCRPADSSSPAGRAAQPGRAARGRPLRAAWRSKARPIRWCRSPSTRTRSGLFLETVEPGIVPGAGLVAGRGAGQGPRRCSWTRSGATRCWCWSRTARTWKATWTRRCAQAKRPASSSTRSASAPSAGQPVPDFDREGRPQRASRRTTTGSAVVSRLHMETLEAIARGTGGRSSASRPTDPSLSALAARDRGHGAEDARARVLVPEEGALPDPARPSALACLALALLLPLPGCAAGSRRRAQAAVAGDGAGLARLPSRSSPQPERPRRRAAAGAAGQPVAPVDEVLLRPRRLTRRAGRSTSGATIPRRSRSFERAAARAAAGRARRASTWPTRSTRTASSTRPAALYRALGADARIAAGAGRRASTWATRSSRSRTSRAPCRPTATRCGWRPTTRRAAQPGAGAARAPEAAAGPAEAATAGQQQDQQQNRRTASRTSQQDQTAGQRSEAAFGRQPAPSSRRPRRRRSRSASRRKRACRRSAPCSSWTRCSRTRRRSRRSCSPRGKTRRSGKRKDW